MFASIKYSFEYYQDSNGEQIIKVTGSDLANNEINFNVTAKEFSSGGLFSWDKEGVTFSLTIDGDLTISQINQQHNPSLEISGAKIVKLAGQSFKQLNIVSQEVKFLGDVTAVDLKIAAASVTNAGTIQASETVDIKTSDFDNNNGAIYAGDSVNLTVNNLQNNNGNVSGIKNTTITIDNNLINNQQSEIGVDNSTTVIKFNNKTEMDNLGVVRGQKVKFINPAIIKGQGIIAAEEQVELINEEFANSVIEMPHIDIQTPILHLETNDFKLKDQTNCEHTVLHTKVGQSLTLTNAYHTAGTVAIKEQGVDLANIAEVMQQVASSNQADYEVSLQATIQANKGITVLTPHAKLRLGDNEQQDKHPVLLAPSGKFEAYVNQFDIEKGGVAAKSGFIQAPKGTSLGRLIEDPSRQAFATFYAHAHSSGSSNLGRNIQQLNYKFLGQSKEVYDGKHLLIMPIAIPNGSFLNIEKITEISGNFNNQGELNTDTLKIDSENAPSVWEAGVANVTSNCELNGQFILKRTTTDFDYLYHNWCDTHKNCSAKLCNSDPAQLNVKGVLSGNAVVMNEASWLHVEKASELQVVSKDFTSSIYQQFISGSVEERQSLSAGTAPGRIHSNSIYTGMRGWGSSCCSYAAESRGSLGYVPYAMGFLSKTNNFSGAQQVFPAQTSFGSEVILPARNTQLEGMLTAPKLLLTVGGKLALGSPNPYYINPANPVRDLGSKGFNIHTTHVAEDLKQVIEQETKPKFHFVFREKFWFDEAASQEFYSSIFDDIVIKAINGGFDNPTKKSIFLLSPKYLLKRVIEECQEVLMRGYIYEGRPIDEDLIKELHHNAAEYLTQTKLSAEAFQQALILANSNTPTCGIELPTKPMIYYKALMNDQGLETLAPYLYIPEKMINEVRARRGGLVKTNLLATLPENLTPEELLEQAKHLSQTLYEALLAFFNQHPEQTKYLKDKATELKNQGVDNTSSIAIYSAVAAKEVLSVVEGETLVQGSVDGGQILLASLLADVNIKSQVARTYHGSTENFDDIILSQAKVHADNILRIFAGNNAIFEGAETYSGLLTEVQALANVLDVPIALIRQRVQHFCERKKQGFIKDTDILQHNSKHKSEGTIRMEANNSAILQAPEIEAEAAEIISKNGKTKILDTQELHEHEEKIEIKKRRFTGTKKKTKNSNRYSSRSKGAKFKVNRLLLAGKEGVEICNITSTAAHNILSSPDGEVSILLGRNRFASSSITSSKSPCWQKSKTENIESATYSSSSISGAISIDATRIMLEKVRGKALDFLSQIEQTNEPASDIIYSTVDEYYSRHSKTKQGPGPGLIALVAVATAIATQGTCAGWAANLGFKAGAHAMVTAEFTGLCSQAAASIVANNGNPLKAIKALASVDTVKSLATSMITAGILHKVCEVLKIPKLEDRVFLKHAEYNIAKSSVSTILNASINNQDLDEAVLAGLVEAAIATVLAATTISKSKEELDKIKNNIMHASLGALKGTVVGRNGPLVGALDGLISAVLPEYFPDKTPEAEKLPEFNAEEAKQQEVTLLQQAELKEQDNENKGEEFIALDELSVDDLNEKPKTDNSSWLKRGIDKAASLVIGTAHADEGVESYPPMPPIYNLTSNSNDIFDELYQGIKISDDGMSCSKMEETNPLPFLLPAIVKSQSEQRPVSYMFDRFKNINTAVEHSSNLVHNIGADSSAGGISKGFIGPLEEPLGSIDVKRIMEEFKKCSGRYPTDAEELQRLMREVQPVETPKCTYNKGIVYSKTIAGCCLGGAKGAGKELAELLLAKKFDPLVVVKDTAKGCAYGLLQGQKAALNELYECQKENILEVAETKVLRESYITDVNSREMAIKILAEEIRKKNEEQYKLSSTPPRP
jgi:hypothetical protein